MRWRRKAPAAAGPGAAGLLLMIVALFVAVPASARVEVDHDPDVNFIKYATYRWRQGTPAPLLEEKRIVKAVEVQLQSKGLRQAETIADLYVVTHAGARSGTLLVDLVDRQTEALVWRGTASYTLGYPQPKSEKKINKALKKMFKEFPPQGK